MITPKRKDRCISKYLSAYKLQLDLTASDRKSEIAVCERDGKNLFVAHVSTGRER
jgi:hypothetical protein